ncbi:biotin transporter BioY [Alkalihalophilus pseudofirmus]|uniref:Biotin transporter n=1 Tax=Alkalihalophilus pseudofirmus TaxID=79885 RepID=A0AAJ2NPC3_ALKPS|nr:biotin transporter BioY [Alkalihalophilus pseudofirmus]MDV2886105.1 biotin transporter BioY [Alkalihalophilus pseudofirmus]
MSSRKRYFSTIELVLIPMFAALMAIGANVTSFLVIGGVPITLQTLFATLAGALLGSRRGALAMMIYVLIGLAGFPVFAQFRGGLGSLVSPTFGFLLSFIILAFVVGKIIERNSKKSVSTFMVACFVGLTINYVLGTNYMYFAYQFIADLDAITYGMAWSWMVAPLVKDIIFTIFAAVLASRIYHTVNKNANPLQRKLAS